MGTRCRVRVHKHREFLRSGPAVEIPRDVYQKEERFCLAKNESTILCVYVNLPKNLF